jgi:phosphoribosylamine--glycine ligase
MQAQNAKVLVIGGGGREHAIVWRLIQDGVKTIFCAPGNAGTQLSGAKNVAVDIKNNEAILDFIHKNQIDLTIVGPEDPLARGLVNLVRGAGYLIVGPTAEAAQLETSKIFARTLMEKHGIPQPRYDVSMTMDYAELTRKELGLPLVIKADGLAGGKGAIVCRTEEEWQAALQDMFVNKKFGAASDRVLIEECLVGEEISVFALCDYQGGFRVIGDAQDHKRLLDNDLGPNTGGMGAYSPVPLPEYEGTLVYEIEEKIIGPILQAMKNIGHPYTGFLYAGLMIVDGHPKVIEFNARLGDPETQVILPLIGPSFFNLLYDSVTVGLENSALKFSNLSAVAVVLATDGYPEGYSRGASITLPVLSAEDKFSLIFQAGTTIIQEGEAIKTNGGRIINAVGLGYSLKDAITQAYQVADQIFFADKQFRTDIGARGLKYLEMARRTNVER